MPPNPSSNPCFDNHLPPIFPARRPQIPIQSSFPPFAAPCFKLTGLKTYSRNDFLAFGLYHQNRWLPAGQRLESRRLQSIRGDFEIMPKAVKYAEKAAVYAAKGAWAQVVW